jgi:CMP/dCMP kinase
VRGKAGNIACVNISAGLASETSNRDTGERCDTGDGDDTGMKDDTGAKLVVAIDGPSGSGKSSASRGAARALGLRYLDTGATYRALTWWMLEHGIDVTDRDAVASHVSEARIEVGTDPANPWTMVDGTDVSQAIRTREVTGAVSAVASVPEVRARLIALQRNIIAQAGERIVAEGRDIGTVVAPDADVKVFLTAGAAARAVRRAAQANWSQAATRTEQDRRDSLDAAQSEKAADAVEIDSTALTLDEVTDMIVRMATCRTDR